MLAVLLTACGSDDGTDTASSGKGTVEVRLTTRSYVRGTRATGDWADPDNTKEKINDYRIAFVNSSGIVKELISGNAAGAEEHGFKFLLPPGVYTVYAFANFDGHKGADHASHNHDQFDFSDLGITKGNALPDLTTKNLPTINGWVENIPMTSHAGGQSITVREAENQTFEVELVRSMARLEFNFTNNSTQRLDILGYEIEPLTTTNVALLEPAEGSIATDKTTETYKVDLSSSPITLWDAGNADSEKKNPAALTLYVNETNASATETVNEYAIRLKVRRYFTSPAAEQTEYRYGFTVNRANGGFTYIHRNDWIKIPINFGDWQFQVEALPFPPIAGYQARMVTADAQSITFNSGGYIVLAPRFRKSDDPVGVWRGLDDSMIKLSLPDELTDWNNAAKTATHADYIETADGDYKDTGIILNGDLSIFEQYFVKMPSGDIVGKLTNEKTPGGGDYTGTVTVTLRVKLDGLIYQFHYNIIKQ